MQGTTSNNRALLKLAEIAAPGACVKSSPLRTFVLAFKCVSRPIHAMHLVPQLTLRRHRYPAPTALAPSLTYPIPTPSPLSGLLSHLYALASRLTPYTFSVRRLHASEAPKLSAHPTRDEWDALGDALAGTARLKKVGGLGWVEKGAFLEFRRLKGR